MASRRLAIAPNAAEVLKHLPPGLKRAVRAALRGLSDGTIAGESLQRELEGLHKYPVRRYRIVYSIDRGLIKVLAIGHRRTIYEVLAESVRRAK